MSATPSAIASQVLDAIGSDFVLGDIKEGSREAQVLLRAYLVCLEQLLRSANWAFARKSAPLQLLADARGINPLVGTVVPSGFVFEYAYPTDCMRVRFVQRRHQNPSGPFPAGNIAVPAGVPQTTGSTEMVGHRIRPARYVIATDSNYTGPLQSPLQSTIGVSPTNRTVILTDVENAHCTYTALMLYSDNWDSLFRAALVAYIASEVALPLTKDKKFGLAIRGQQIQIAKMKIEQARLDDGNEGATTTSDIRVDWMEGRRTGGGRFGYGGASGGWGGGDGFEGAGWDSCSFADGTSY